MKSFPFRQAHGGKFYHLGEYVSTERELPGTSSYLVFHGVKRGLSVKGLFRLRTAFRSAIRSIAQETGAFVVIPIPSRKVGLWPPSWDWYGDNLDRGIVYGAGVLVRRIQLPFFVGRFRYRPSVQEHFRSLRLDMKHQASHWMAIKRPVIVVDDVVTEGRIMRAAIQKLAQKCVPVIPFALLRTQRSNPSEMENWFDWMDR